jgi:hypothetical protein
MTKDEALKLALRALRFAHDDGYENEVSHDAITAIKKALAAPTVHEPVAWMYQCTADNSGPVLLQHRTNWAESCTGLWIETPLYTTPPAAQQEPFEYWNAVEGWVKIDEVREHFDSVGCGTIYKTAGDGRVPLTAAKRQWAGLTDESVVSAAARVLSDRVAASCNVDCGDMWMLHGNDSIEDARAMLEAAEAKLKNNT